MLTFFRTVFLVALCIATFYGSSLMILFFKDADKQIIGVMLSGFAGAFFAFFFVCIAAVFSRIYQREVRNQNGMFRLFHFVNLSIQAISDNLYSIESFTKTVEKQSMYEEITFWHGHLGDIPIDPNVVHDLWNADLLNKTISLMVGLQKAKSSLDTLFASYNDYRAAFVSGHLEKKNFIRLSESHCSEMNEVANFLRQCNQECVDVAATARVLMNRQSLVTYIHKFLSDQDLSNRQKKKIKSERVQLEKEIEETRRKSLKKIEEIHKTAKRGQP